MSTFSLLNTAYSGLAAARAALEVTGQNVANVGTEGYTRQRVAQVSVPGNDYSSRYTLGLNIGQGTLITGVSRLADQVIDARVRDTAGSSGYWSATSAALATVETQLAEPSDSGLSAALDRFWSAWQTMSNSPTSSTAANTLIGAAQNLTGRISDGWTAARTGWLQQRESATATMNSANQAAAAVATLNQEILKITVAGGNANELMDRRSAALTTLSSMVGATTRENTNGTIDVIAGGNTLVSGFTARAFVLTGSVSMESANTSPVQLAFADRPSVAVQAEGGTLAGQIAALAPAGSGGVFTEAAAAYDTAATALATAVNAVHTTGQSSTGATGLAFFSFPSPGRPPALGLTVVPTSVSGIAASSATPGASDGSVADAIAQLGAGDSAPDAAWNAFVTAIGARSQAAATRSAVADTAASTARNAQVSQSSVDLDEETANLVVYQHAYQGAARVLTAIDEMLDTLINRTGLVGRA